MGAALARRVLFGGLSLAFFVMAAMQVHAAGLTGKAAFALLAGIVLAFACATAKG